MKTLEELHKERAEIDKQIAERESLLQFKKGDEYYIKVTVEENGVDSVNNVSISRMVGVNLAESFFAKPEYLIPAADLIPRAELEAEEPVGYANRYSFGWGNRQSTLEEAKQAAINSGCVTEEVAQPLYRRPLPNHIVDANKTIEPPKLQARDCVEHLVDEYAPEWFNKKVYNITWTSECGRFEVIVRPKKTRPDTPKPVLVASAGWRQRMVDAVVDYGYVRCRGDNTAYVIGKHFETIQDLLAEVVETPEPDKYFKLEKDGHKGYYLKAGSNKVHLSDQALLPVAALLVQQAKEAGK